jgi:hypothetical protein
VEHDEKAVRNIAGPHVARVKILARGPATATEQQTGPHADTYT